MNNNDYTDVSPNCISDFYKNTHILITGATGFVGKVLLEKILRSCEAIDTIYILLRPKRGKSVEQRYQEIFKSSMFDKIKKENPDLICKVKYISGDICAEKLGLKDHERKMLVENVNIVLHPAATVRFDETISDAFNMNTIGTRRIIELCREMRYLKSFVYVSTAYSNANKKIIDEIVYNHPYDSKTIVNCLENSPAEFVQILKNKIIGTHPNTYTLTKSLAENIVLENSSIIPSCIVRPSIITSAWKDPYPGWVDSLSGINGIFMECARGTISSVICNEKCKMDLIPVDVVVNTIIAAAWHTYAHRSNSMRIYNCTSGNINPITCKEFRLISHQYLHKFPSKYVALYPKFTFRTNTFMHVICSTIYHTLPAIIFDIYLYMTKRKTIMVKTSKKFYDALDKIKYFTTKEWDFRTTQMESLMEATKNATDGENFYIDIRKSNGFSWDTYVRDFLLGTRQYILKDDLKTLPSAQKKLNRIYWFQKLMQLISIYYIIKFVFKFIR